MEEGIGQGGLILKIGRLAQQVYQRMALRQRTEGCDKVLDLPVGGLDAKAATILLQHIDACPPMGCIDHEMHRAIGLEDAAQGAEPCAGVRERVEDAGAHDLIKARLQFMCPLEGELVDLEVVQVILAFELLSMVHAPRAKVDAGHSSPGPTQRMFGCLRCPAAGDQD